MTKVTIDREERYTVIKHKDLTADDRSDLDQLIQSRHIPTRKCLVIESDWPEYEPAWRMIEARVTGASTKPATVQAELTSVRCHCAREYPHDSYDAGFIAGSGMCQVCDAALPAKDIPQQALPCVAVSDAARDVLAERQRQISAEGWTPEHDDEHGDGSMALAASCYACASAGFDDAARDWPWSDDWFKPSSPRRDLIKAGALILAEIERLDRAAAPSAEGGE